MAVPRGPRPGILVPAPPVPGVECRIVSPGNGEVSKYLAAIGAASLTREDLVGALARCNGADAFDVDGIALLPELIRLVPEALALEQRILPVHRSGTLLFVAVPDGAAGRGLADLEQRLGLRVEAVPVAEIDVPGLLVKAHQLLRRKTRPTSPSAAAAVPVEDAKGPELDALGLPEPILQRLRKILAGPPGLIVASGPARSGKTTTLRSIRLELRRQGQKVAGLDRTHGVASVEEVLQGDPDALLIDETSSPAVAARALRAASEGRRVVLAFQAADSLAALARLGELKGDPHLTATVLRAGLNQRLLGGVCPRCAESKPEEAAVLEDLRLEALLKAVPLRRGRGCQACRKTGVQGHVAVFEYGERGADGALREGFQPLIADALRKLLEGRVSLKDVSEQVPFTQILQAADRLNVRKLSP